MSHLGSIIRLEPGSTLDPIPRLPNSSAAICIACLTAG
jgi:hypothetical protein